MKKLTAIILTCAMFICAAASCSDKKEDSSSSGKKAETTTVADTTSDKDADDEKSDEKKDDKDSDDKEKDNKENDDEKSDSDKKDEDTTEKDKDDIKKGEPASDDVMKELNKLVEKFAQSTVNNDAEGLMNTMFPDSIVKALVDSGAADSGEFSPIEEGQEVKILECSATDATKLDEKVFEVVKTYFDMYAEMLGAEDTDYTIEKGYAFTMDIKSEVDGERDDMHEEACAIYVMGSGWKVLPLSEEQLIAELDAD